MLCNGISLLKWHYGCRVIYDRIWKKYYVDETKISWKFHSQYFADVLMLLILYKHFKIFCRRWTIRVAFFTLPKLYSIMLWGTSFWYIFFNMDFPCLNVYRGEWMIKHWDSLTQYCRQVIPGRIEHALTFVWLFLYFLKHESKMNISLFQPTAKCS